MSNSDLFIITRDTRDAIVAYLGQKPYVEVYEGISALANLQPLSDSIFPFAGEAPVAPPDEDPKAVEEEVK